MRREAKKNWRTLLAVLALIGLRLGFCCVAGLVIVWLEPYLGIIPAAVLGLLVGGVLITLTGTWQWQWDRGDQDISKNQD